MAERLAAGVTRREHLARVPLVEPCVRDSRVRNSARSRRWRRASSWYRPVRTFASTICDDNAPCVSVRLQEVFGLTATPRIGGGAVAVTFKLLSPAQRPLQITRDLDGFWRSSYAAVRKEMRGRYPRHAWPENPLEAAPTRGTGRPRRR